MCQSHWRFECGSAPHLFQKGPVQLVLHVYQKLAWTLERWGIRERCFGFEISCSVLAVDRRLRVPLPVMFDYLVRHHQSTRRHFHHVVPVPIVRYVVCQGPFLETPRLLLPFQSRNVGVQATVFLVEQEILKHKAMAERSAPTLRQGAFHSPSSSRCPHLLPCGCRWRSATG